MKNEDGLNAMVCALDLLPESIHEKMRKAIDKELTSSYSAKVANFINPNELGVIFKTSKTKEDQKMKTEKIVELWYSKVTKALVDRRDEKVIELTNEDPLHKELIDKLDEVEKQITKMFGEVEAHKGFMNDVINQYYIEDFCTEATDEKIKEANNEFEKYLEGLRSTRAEVRTMLEPCETYLQELSVLAAFGIIKSEQCPKITV